MTPWLLKAENLGRRFGSHWVIRDLNFEVLHGQVLAVTGPNGQGKSTLLKLLCGLLEPSQGRVHLAGSLGVSALDMALYPQLTGREHVVWLSKMKGISTDPATLLTEVGLSSAVDRAAGAYSTGMRARLKLALALLGEPPLLMLDEPTAALDEEGQALIHRVIAAQKAKGAVILATNDRADLAQATHELTLA